ncbi:type II toxin-antitoxin system VapC family toxin [Treponema parvum]|uniref:Type II toxin-antitoxin system VapC family toxin n=1 Tax=Treponema parvum TaxID=138851 RepID=A0A975F3A6_9SPIR|nr:type II toxin-antitoxin system VapC family toxin [Treponema parvum]QTQ13612.1 type II toxin-antitoxin system VapC family toxin [Treponema parvum]QTQ15832.1 type II toxin-antitoxin system VapC family toxin [Treponema parvum]
MYLLDTHTFLWFLHNSPHISQKALNIIGTEEQIYVSIASFWEIAIKKSIGKLKIEYPIQKIETLCCEKDISLLHITSKHLDTLISLPNIHNDPFDRLLISQAMSENLSIITKDSIIPQYPVETIWQ